MHFVSIFIGKAATYIKLIVSFKIRANFARLVFFIPYQVKFSYGFTTVEAVNLYVSYFFP